MNDALALEPKRCGRPAGHPAHTWVPDPTSDEDFACDGEYDARHRAGVPVKTRTHTPGFMPRHCAGDTCLHNHPEHLATGRLLGTWRNRLRRNRGAA